MPNAVERTGTQVGDKVRLNDDGLIQCFGTTRGLARMKQIVLTITSHDPVSMTEPAETHIVEVDDQEINQFLLDDRCFDLVEHD